MPDVIEQFRTALRGRGITPPDELIADGHLHRCDTEGKRGKGDGAYVLHIDGVSAGGFENHRDGMGWENWKAESSRTFTPAERAEFQERIAAIRHERDAVEAKRRADARKRAEEIWSAAKPGAHPYLARKGVGALGTRISRGNLIVSLRDALGTLHSLQFIEQDGGKKFLTGGRVSGCYFSIRGAPNDVICIAEGFATGASVHQATGYPVAVAFNALNLDPVARALRAKLPDARLIVCGDDDRETAGNPGRTKALAAARAVGGLVAFPVFAGAVA